MTSTPPAPYVHQEYPKWMRHVTLDAVLAMDPAHETRLRRDGFRPTLADARRVAAGEPEPAVPAQAAPPPPPAPAPPTEAELAATLHGAKAEDVVAAIATEESIDGLLRLRAREVTHPRNPRKTILKAVEERVLELVSTALTPPRSNDAPPDVDGDDASEDVTE